MTALKNNKFDDLTRPWHFYATFHMEHAYLQALFTNKMDFCGDELNIQQATEPTDIVWENRHVRKCERRSRFFIAVLIMALCSFGAFAFMVFIIKRKLLI